MSDVVLDSEHRYWRGVQELTSISSILRLWPIKPDWDTVDPAVIANANERGREVDTLLTAWIAGQLQKIPAGYREDSVELFKKLLAWDHLHAIPSPQSQVILADDEIAGTADIVGDGIIADLKTVYSLQPTYGLQLGGYCHLYEAQHGKLPHTCGIIHVTKRFSEPKWVPFDVSIVVSEFRTLLAFWRLVKRKANR